jgi:hypothetical protein
VRRAAEESKRTRPARSDRAALIDRIVEQRLLVPEAEARVSKRRLARETRSAYARIAQCEKRILDQVRADLAEDTETQRLRAEASRRVEGLDAPIDAALEAELERVRIDGFVARLKAAPPDRRGAMLLSLLDAAGAGIEVAARSLLARMTVDRRAEFLAGPA